MEDIVSLFGIVTPFAFVITIVWLVLHYKERRRREKYDSIASSTQVTASNAELNAVAERMEHRIDALERILDAEAPGWRKRHHEHS